LDVKEKAKTMLKSLKKKEGSKGAKLEGPLKRPDKV